MDGWIDGCGKHKGLQSPSKHFQTLSVESLADDRARLIQNIHLRCSLRLLGSPSAALTLGSLTYEQHTEWNTHLYTLTGTGWGEVIPVPSPRRNSNRTHSEWIWTSLWFHCSNKRWKVTVEPAQCCFADCRFGRLTLRAHAHTRCILAADSGQAPCRDCAPTSING